MKILVLNSGSSSLKFQLFAMDPPEQNGAEVLATGLIEQIGAPQGQATLTYNDDQGQVRQLIRQGEINDHEQALTLVAQLLQESQAMSSVAELDGIGHRVVHGGEEFQEPVLIDGRVQEAIKRLSPLAPLHNPANLSGIQAVSRAAPDTPQVAVFDTAFHQSLPEAAYTYALPYHLYEKHQVRRYGFHGTSHQFVSQAAAEFLGRPYGELSTISLHLGNGASAAAIKGGCCLDTSMGLTPLEGLVMGSRCGDIDPAIPFYLARQTGMDLQGLEDLLNNESGLKGLCGASDMRSVSRRAKEGDSRARLAVDISCHRLRKYIGAYLAVLGGAHCLLFTGGIGENSATIRQRTCQGLAELGIRLDEEKNQKARGGEISQINKEDSEVAILVVPTNEELEIARQTKRLIASRAS